MITVENVFDQISIKSFEEILNMLEVILPSDKLRLIDAFKNHNSNLLPLQSRWTESVNLGIPDFSVYSGEDYLNEVFNCWKMYSRRYLRLLQKYSNNEASQLDVTKIKNILDLGCGLGLTTLGLKHIFPTAKVFGTNFKDSYQYAVATQLVANTDCYMVDEVDTLNCGSIDLIFASEFFEHILEPIDLLISLILTYKPRYFVIANTFTKMSLGHFLIYKYKNNEYSGKDISKLFNSMLRQYGYVQLDTGFFNNRPTIWKRTNTIRSRLI